MEMNSNLLVVLIGLISLGLGYFTYFLNKYTDKINVEIKNIKNNGERQIFENALNDVHDIILKAVTTAEQVSVKSLKASAADGKLTKEEAVDIKNEVFNNVIDNLSNDTKNILNKNIVNLEKYIKGSIETTVYTLK